MQNDKLTRRDFYIFALFSTIKSALNEFKWKNIFTFKLAKKKKLTIFLSQRPLNCINFWLIRSLALPIAANMLSLISSGIDSFPRSSSKSQICSSNLKISFSRICKKKYIMSKVVEYSNHLITICHINIIIFMNTK